MCTSGTVTPTRNIDCSKTIWLLTTNKFDDDIDTFSMKYSESIEAFKDGTFSSDKLRAAFENFIRPKLRTFFKGGLTRRIDCIVPFFRFDEEEAFVVADMYLDSIRLQYLKQPTKQRLVGNVEFDVTDAATEEIAKYLICIQYQYRNFKIVYLNFVPFCF
jgi:ATP-dependent Clp protease ATP-binding subunit ClpA